MRENRGCRRFFFRGMVLHPLWRALIYLLAFLIAETVLDLVVSLLYFGIMLLLKVPMDNVLNTVQKGQLPGPLLLGVGATRLLAALGLALLMGHFLDREPVETMGLDPARLGRDTARGMALGTGTMLLIGAAVLAMNPQVLYRGSAPWWAFPLDAVALLLAAAAEEVAFRGYLQRLFTTWRGPVVGILVPSIIFSLFHALNPNVNALALLNIALAGAVFALAVERTGTLWLAIAYHYTWNLTQGPILGLPVSGMPWEGLLTLRPGGPSLLTGGSFGPEGGLLSTMVLLLSVVPLWFLTQRPATLAGILRRQRADMDRWGPVPYRHHTLKVSDGFFNEFVLSAIEQKPRMGEIVLLLRRADGQILLHNKIFYLTGVFRLPSGGIQPGESVLAAAYRETREETGLDIETLRPLGVISVTFQDGLRRRFFHSWLLLADVEGIPRPEDDSEKIADFRWVPPEVLAEIEERLRGLPPEWADWGRFRALAHEAAIRWMSSLSET